MSASPAIPALDRVETAHMRPHALAMRAGLIPVGIGISVGLIGAMWLGKAAESFLIGIHWFDPLSYLTAACLLLLCATTAGLIAGWRVKRIPPSEALRTE